ncbi:MAG: hypothetical protein JXR97_14220 [Planctomycetes bacterium]|nr:hypothetical protein [Planctomycetota bacterium]
MISLWKRQGFEFMPVEFNLCPSLREEYVKRTGNSELPYNEYFEFPWRGVPGPKCPEREPINWEKYFIEQGAPLQLGAHVSEWGVGAEKGSAACVHMTRKRHPMSHFEDIEQFEAYPYPEYDKATNDHIREVVKEIHGKGYVATANWACTIWETAWYTRSMEQLMMDMLSDEELATYHLDRITGLAENVARLFADAGVDHLHLGDDIGMQSSIMMSEEMYREWIKPRLKRVIDAARAAKPDIIISYHSCGYVIPFIPDLIEVGVDVLNPVQPECMSFEELHAEYGERLSFWGTIGTQTTMPFGTPEEVRKEVIRNLEIAGEKGGLLCAPTHLLEPEVPWENILAYVEACKDFASAGSH